MKTDFRVFRSPIRALGQFVLPAALAAGILLSFGLPAQVRRSVPGQFDYYLLSLSWAPEFCAQPSDAAASPRECAAGRNIGFIVHGLWPEMEEGAAPESCGSARSVSRGLVNSMLASMPEPELIQHEWATHGTCTGLNANAYFTTVLLARAAVQVPVQISSITGQTTESPGEIEAQFEGTNPSFPKGSFHVSCRNGALTEVRACFDKNLKPRVCGASAGECRATSVTIRPPR